MPCGGTRWPRGDDGRSCIGSDSSAPRTDAPRRNRVQLTARGAREEDLGELAALRERALNELRAARGGDLLALGELSSGDLTAELVAVVAIDGALVGYCECGRRLLEDGRAVCRVGAFYVDTEARGVGAGEELMTFATEWARRQHCAGIDVLALPGSREAKNFFESSGFSARLIVMHRRLGE